MPRPSDPNAKIKLLAAAEAVFVRSGLDAAKVEDITRRAGLSKGAFYLHFDSKEDAFRQLVEAMVARLASYIEDCPVDAASQAPSLDDFLDLWVRQDAEMFEFVWQNRGLVGLLLEGGKSAAYRHLVDEFADRASGKTRILLEQGIAAGLYRGDLDLDVTCAFIGGAYDRLARKIVREKKKPDLHALLRQVQTLFLRGIASPRLARQIDTSPKKTGNKTGRPVVGEIRAVSRPPAAGRASKKLPWRAPGTLATKMRN